MSEKTPEERMRRLRDEDLWTTDAPRVRTRVVSPRMQALHWAVTVVVVGALVAGALSGIAAFRSARERAATDTRSAVTSADVLGTWNMSGLPGRLHLGAPGESDYTRSDNGFGSLTALSAVWIDDCGTREEVAIVVEGRMTFDGLGGSGDCSTSALEDLEPTRSVVAHGTGFDLVSADGEVVTTLTPAAPWTPPAAGGDYTAVPAASLDAIVPLPDGARPVDDLDGRWVADVVDPDRTDYVTFVGDRWLGGACSGGDGAWLSGSRGQWASTYPLAVSDVGCIPDGTAVPVAEWIEHARAAAMIDGKLAFVAADGSVLGTLKQVDDASTSAPHSLVGIWDPWGAPDSDELEIDRPSATYDETAIPLQYTRGCGTVAGQLVALGDRARLDAGVSGSWHQCLPTTETPMPYWWSQVARFHIEGSELFLLDATDHVVQRLSRSGEPEQSDARGPLKTDLQIDVTTELPTGATPASAKDIRGQWVPVNSFGDAIFGAGTWSATSGCADRPRSVWLTDGAGHFASGFGSALVRAMGCTDPSPVGGWIRRAHAIGFVGDELTLYDADGEKLGALLKKEPDSTDTADADADPRSLAGEWRGSGAWLHSGVMFSGSTWSTPGTCVPSTGTWAMSAEGVWTAKGTGPSQQCGSVRNVDGSDFTELGDWIIRATAATLSGDRLTLSRAGKTLGYLTRVDPNSVPPRMPDASNALLGSWKTADGSVGLSFSRNDTAFVGRGLSVPFLLDCGDVASSSPAGAVGGGLTIGSPEFTTDDCGGTGSMPTWVERVRGFTSVDADHLTLTDADGSALVSLVSQGAAPAASARPSITGLPEGVRPVGADAIGTWKLLDTNAADAQTLTLDGRSFTATTADRCHPAGGPWATDADGHWATGA